MIMPNKRKYEKREIYKKYYTRSRKMRNKMTLM